MTRVAQVAEKGVLPALLRQKLAVAPRHYLVTDTHASFQHHRWLFPAPGVVALRIYPDDSSWWQKHLAVAGVHASTEPPGRKEVIGKGFVVVLRSDLTPSLHARRQIVQGVSYESAEDSCLNLLAQARGESAYAEVAAILVAGRETLDWVYLVEQTTTTGQAVALGILAEIVNREAGRELIPQTVIEQLRERTSHHPIGTFPPHPPRRWLRRRAIKGADSGSYPRSSARWGTQVFLPRHVVGKVVFDLRPRWASG
ncbi:MAG: hypothetical protein ISS49_04585 [Anaerolineae bacterium]|nr:hypothetical protein [Anaerolineae bacterium]